MLGDDLLYIWKLAQGAARASLLTQPYMTREITATERQPACTHTQHACAHIHTYFMFCANMERNKTPLWLFHLFPVGDFPVHI